MASTTRSDGDAAVDRRFLELLADRRRRRQLLSLKIVCCVLTAGFLASLGLTVWQLTVPFALAGVYVGLAGVFATATGVCATPYHQRRKRGRGDRAGY
ncbi:hypothetical protein ACF061_17165 [Streptomyces sp. NPDC015220]|uniref:hypothetical protein n=1 Tax=Streptomyces sp. NPDC015220 TaxID=3364947 RepID=UPI0036F58808